MPILFRIMSIGIAKPSVLMRKLTTFTTIRNTKSPNSIEILLALLEANPKSNTRLEVGRLLVEPKSRPHVQRNVLRQMNDRTCTQDVRAVLSPGRRIDTEILQVQRQAFGHLVPARQR